MRAVFLIRVLLGVGVVAALSAGCAGRQASSAPEGSAPAASGVSGSAASDSATPPNSSGPVDASLCPTPAATTITVTETDNGRTVCAQVSQRIEIYLHGTVAEPWSAITAAGGGLRPTASGKLSLPVGVTGAVFTAVTRGPAEVVSTRPTCAGQPTGAGCTIFARFRVTVSVRG
jgi:hypothetical protein